MEHAEALRLGAVERYLLDELATEDRDRFEEHFFTCPECGEDVRITATFIDNLRSVLTEPYEVHASREPQSISRAKAPRSWWPSQAGIAAAVALLAIVGYQNVVIIPAMRGDLAREKAPQAYAQRFITQDRSPANNPIEVAQGERKISLLFSKIPDRTFHFYRCELQNQAGDSIQRFTVPVPQGEEWALAMPVAGLTSGTYILDVRGSDSPDGSSEPLAQYHFHLNFR